MFNVRHHSLPFPMHVSCPGKELQKSQHSGSLTANMLRVPKPQQFLAKISWPASSLCTQCSHTERTVRESYSPTTSPPWEEEASHLVNPMSFLWESYLLSGGLRSDRRCSELRTKQPIHRSFTGAPTALRTPKKSQLKIVLLT